MSAPAVYQQRLRMCTDDKRCTFCGTQTANGQAYICSLCHIASYTCKWGSALEIGCRGLLCPCTPSRRELFKIEHVAGLGQVYKWKANAQ